MMCAAIRHFIIAIWFANTTIKNVSLLQMIRYQPGYLLLSQLQRANWKTGKSLPACKAWAAKWPQLSVLPYQRLAHGYCTSTAADCSLTWYEHGQQFLHCVHGGDQHHAVLLVRQLLLPLVDHLCHLRHAWQFKSKQQCINTRLMYSDVSLKVSWEWKIKLIVM